MGLTDYGKCTEPYSTDGVQVGQYFEFDCPESGLSMFIYCSDVGWDIANSQGDCNDNSQEIELETPEESSMLMPLIGLMLLIACFGICCALVVFSGVLDDEREFEAGHPLDEDTVVKKSRKNKDKARRSSIGDIVKRASKKLKKKRKKSTFNISEEIEGTEKTKTLKLGGDEDSDDSDGSDVVVTNSKKKEEGGRGGGLFLRQHGPRRKN